MVALLLEKVVFSDSSPRLVSLNLGVVGEKREGEEGEGELITTGSELLVEILAEYRSRLLPEELKDRILELAFLVAELLNIVCTPVTGFVLPLVPEPLDLAGVGILDDLVADFVAPLVGVFSFVLSLVPEVLNLAVPEFFKLLL